MDNSSALLRAALGLLFVISLIGLLAVLVKKFGIMMPAVRKPDNKRISVEEISMVDPRRRLILVRCDQREHLILLGMSNDLLIESFAVSQVDITKSNIH